MTLSFDRTDEEDTLTKQIAERYCRILELTDSSALLSVHMSVVATHCNGCKLDLERLLKARRLDFLHDMSGILCHLNRKTGHLEDCFLPRHALPDEQP